MREESYTTNGKTYVIQISESGAGVEVVPTLDGLPLERWSYIATSETAQDFGHYGHNAADELVKIAKLDLDRNYHPK